ncbi:hypothetical protein SAMN05446935_8551 [Burkholderia sp. YR290]|nr:hypothetical protein SAMN05446935_8551 [Burkholderia sp. YR290]
MASTCPERDDRLRSCRARCVDPRSDSIYRITITALRKIRRRNVAELTVFVDYDNVQPAHKRPGPVNLARMIVSLLPTSVLSRYAAVNVRLYGGWRSSGTLTRLAQGLIPDIRQNSPGVLRSQHEGISFSLRLNVDLADKLIGTTSPLEETLVYERDLRKFRTRAHPWQQCANAGNCGFSAFSTIGHDSACGMTNCNAKLGDVLVRDEQKMVDRLIVADMAQSVHVAKARDLVVVSSDTDMWQHVFGTVKPWTRPAHFLTRTLRRVSTEVSLQVLAYNHKRVVKILGVSKTMKGMKLAGR